MLYVYLVSSAVLLLLGEWAFELFRQSWSWWAVPLLFIGLFLGFVILHIAFFVIAFGLANPKTTSKRSERFYRTLIKYSLPLAFTLARVKISITGVEKVPNDTRFLLVCNHQHDFDPAIILYALPDSEIAFIGKKEIYTEMPFVGKIMSKLRCMPIDRENNREAAKTIVNATRLIKADEASVALFPEGYTNIKGEELLPFRNGAFKIAYKADAPIVVCVLNNTRSILKNIFIRETRIDFKVLDVIYPQDFKDLHTVELGDKLYEQMNATVSELRK